MDPIPNSVGQLIRMRKKRRNFFVLFEELSFF
jgi:hypothetical protein